MSKSAQASNYGVSNPARLADWYDRQAREHLAAARSCANDRERCFAHAVKALSFESWARKMRAQ